MIAPAMRGAPAQHGRGPVISIVIAVYQSEHIVGTTIDAVVATCDREGWTYELVAVDDASRDRSLEVLQAAASRHSRLRVIALPTNVGQQAALMRGLAASTGDVVVCLDDDMQHPPSAIPTLVRAVQAGRDAVFARFARPRHAPWRRLGSVVVRLMDRLVFHAPRHLQVTSFRAMSRAVVDRVCAYSGTSPYVRGQILLACHSPANVDVEHNARGGPSSYRVWSLVGVVLRTLLEWSRGPALSALGVGVLFIAGAALSLSSTGWAARTFGPLAMVHGVALTALGLVGLWRAQERRAAILQVDGDGAHARRRGV